MDLYHWDQIQALRVYLAKDTLAQKSLFTRIREALADGDYAMASELQVEMAAKVEELKSLYIAYEQNIIEC